MTDLKFSFIIPVHKKDNRFLKRCILSIQEQDYEDYEIIVIGRHNKKAYKLCQRLGVDYGECQSENAAAKRNKGFDVSIGNILFFFDADCILFPGMLRLIKDAFEDHPDCGFIYGAYRWNVETLNTFPSRPFDPYLLETSNYISTMSPMKREIFPRFRDNLNYFQDWDLFLRIAKAGHKGHYLPDVLFMTEQTDVRSISGNRKYTYYEKISHIRKINNISQKPICLTSIGAPYQTLQRAKCLHADYFGAHQNTSLIQSPSMFEHRYKMIYVMGFYPSAIHDHVKLFANAQPDTLRVIQWIGTDVWQLRTRFNWETIKYMRDKILRHVDVQLCNSIHLEGELGELGVKANTVYMPLLEDIQPMPLPEKFTIGIYYSDTNPMHNEEFLLDIAKSMPDVDFKFFGGSKKAHEENIEYIPWANITDIISQCSMNLRFTVHDGYPHTPIHFVLAGRQVLLNSEMPCMHYLDMQLAEDNYGECKHRLIQQIRKIKKNPDQELIAKAGIYYRELLAPTKYREIIYSILNKGKEWVFEEADNSLITGSLT